MTGPIDELRDELPNPRQAKDSLVKYLIDEYTALNFYRTHMLYFIVVIGVSSVLVYVVDILQGPGKYDRDHLTFTNALFVCTSAMTTTGLNPIDLGDMSGFQQAIFCVLMILGSYPFVSAWVVLIRRRTFRRKLADVVEHSHTMRRLVKDVEHSTCQDQHGTSSSNSTEPLLKSGGHTSKGRNQGRNGSIKKPSPSQRRILHHQKGYGSMPTPWESSHARSYFRRMIDSLSAELKPEHHGYLTFKPKLDSKGRFLELSEHDRLELGGVEYRALQALLIILVGYQIFWLAIGTIFLVPYAYRSDIKAMLHDVQPGPVNPGWWAFFATVTEFANGGLNVLNSNFIPFSDKAYVLIVAGAIAFAGQTQFPIFLRLSIWLMKKMCPTGSRAQMTLDFLLQHPRRCFLYLFPSRDTWVLFFTQIGIDATAWVCFMVLNIGMSDVDKLGPFKTRLLDGMFQATGLRTSGAYIITLSELAPACLLAFIIVMYISCYPMLLTLRKTNTYEEKSIGIDSSDEDAGGVAVHFQQQLAYDIWFQFFAFFLVTVIERPQLLQKAPGFSEFNIMFEVVSAYGTVGLSTGVPGKDYSLCGSMASLSRIVLCCVMVRGRHRGLPLAIDRSILLPGEDLMRRMDKEYSESGTNSQDGLEELRDDIEQSGKQTAATGGMGEQNPEGRDTQQMARDSNSSSTEGLDRSD